MGMIWTGKSTVKYKKLTSLSGRPCSMIDPLVGDMYSRNRISDLNQPGNTGHTVYIFAWTWNICVGRTKHTSKKNCIFFEELLSENDFEAVLVTFCCYYHGAKASEAVQKIATYQKQYCNCSSCVIICWMTVKNACLEGYLPRC